jgi:signal transduction histidine kinase
MMMSAPPRGFTLSFVDMARHLPRSRFDVGAALVGVALTAVACWVPGGPVADKVAGPGWLLVVYTFLLGVPLAWRRQSPLFAVSLVMAGVALQAVVSGDSVEGLHNMYCLGLSVYSVAAHSTRVRSLVGLGVTTAAWTAYVVENQDIRSGRHNELWAGSFFTLALLAIWLVGVNARARRLSRVEAARIHALEAATAAAIVAERARLARELHDVISHNISVMLLQAAGARAAGSPDADALEKIENCARESLVEMRRLLGVLRADDGAASTAPAPGVDDLSALVDQVRAAGLSVGLEVRGDTAGLPAGVGLSVYRVVQESLTNVLKHAGAATAACVRVEVLAARVTVDVADDGDGPGQDPVAGHGLVGMRERVGAFGGLLETGPGRNGGFRVQASFPLASPDLAATLRLSTLDGVDNA